MMSITLTDTEKNSHHDEVITEKVSQGDIPHVFPEGSRNGGYKNVSHRLVRSIPYPMYLCQNRYNISRDQSVIQSEPKFE
jgi:hypothetical protein